MVCVGSAPRPVRSSDPDQFFPFPLDNKRQDSYSSFENKSQSAYDTHNNGGSTSANHRRPFDNMGSETVVRKHVSDNQMSSILDRRHLEDVTNHQQQQQQQTGSNSRQPRENQALIIDDELNKLDPVSLLSSRFTEQFETINPLPQDSVDEMERKKEKIMLLSLQRRQQQEETKARKEIEAMQRREREREKEDERVRKREEQAQRRAAILEQHKLKKAIEEAEQKGITLDRNELMALKQQHSLLASGSSSGGGAVGGPKLRAQKVVRPRPKTIHVETGSVDLSEASSLSSRNKKGSNSNLTGKQSKHGQTLRLRFVLSFVGNRVLAFADSYF